MLDAQLGRRRREADAVLGDAGERSGVFREDLLDDERGLVVVVVEDLEVLRRLDDGRLTEPGDLRPRIALDLADEFNLIARNKCYYLVEGMEGFKSRSCEV